MARKLKRSVERWLEAERRGAVEAAEAALRGVFRQLPLPAPAAGFAARVMAGVGLARRAAPQPALGWRVAIGGAIVVAAAAAALAPAVASDLLARLSPAAVVGFVVGGLVETCQRLAEGLAFWQIMLAIGRALGSVLTSPPAMAALATALLLSAGGVRLLDRKSVV